MNILELSIAGAPERHQVLAALSRALGVYEWALIDEAANWEASLAASLCMHRMVDIGSPSSAAWAESSPLSSASSAPARSVWILMEWLGMESILQRLSNLFGPRRPHEVQRTAWASVLANDRFICLSTCSGYRASIVDPQGAEICLQPSACDERLGGAVLACLAQSRFVVPYADKRVNPEAGVDAELYDPLRISERYESWVKQMKVTYGYKSRRALFTGLRNCHVSSADGEIVMTPTYRDGKEGWSGFSGEDRGLKIDAVAAPADVGAALRRALGDCK